MAVRLPHFAAVDRVVVGLRWGRVVGWLGYRSRRSQTG